MKNKILVWLVAILVVALAITLILASIWLRRNTSVLSPTPTPQQITENNENFPEMGEDLFNGFVAKALTVPESMKQGVFATARTLNLPADFDISLFATNIQGVRFFTFDDKGDMYVAERAAGRVTLVQDTNDDGIADNISGIDSGLTNVSSVFFYKGDLYAGEEDKVEVYRNINNGQYTKKEAIIPNLPPVGGHLTRTIIVGPDNKIYVSIGSTCNVCEETEIRRAAVVRYNLDGSLDKVFASGLRNSVGIIFHENAEGVSQLWSVDNGRDMIGDDIPPEEVNILVEDGHYGWPYCYGNGFVNPEYDPAKASFCANETKFPAYNMQAHSAPLGLNFGPDFAGSNFPQELRNNLFIAFHGSWNRSIPTGYKVVRINTAKPGAGTVDFITGWLDSSGQVWGRPVGIGFDQNGVMYISDDQAGAIYRVTYNPK